MPTLITTLLMVMAISALNTNNSYADYKKNLFEYTNSTHAANFDSVKTLSLLTRSQVRRGEIIYGGLRLNEFSMKDGSESVGLFQVLVGATITGTYTPYIEIGTDLINLLTTRTNDECDNNNDNQCRINAFVRAGIRIQIQDIISLGVFYEAISFDDHNTRLTGDHNYSGISLGYNF